MAPGYFDRKITKMNEIKDVFFLEDNKIKKEWHLCLSFFIISSCTI